jgi:hypothetical protein
VSFPITGVIRVIDHGFMPVWEVPVPALTTPTVYNAVKESGGERIRGRYVDVRG